MSTHKTYHLPVKFSCETDGSGFWTRKTRVVPIAELELIAHSTDDHARYGEVRVHFDEGAWNTNTDGLIFTDRNFINELKLELKKLGMPAAEYLSYGDKSEQGLTYVQLDCDTAFIAEFKKLLK
jgi:hypothetical protein